MAPTTDRIAVVWGTGDAATPLTAFDAALDEAGLADYNLLGLSSIAPPGATVATPGTLERSFGVGDPVATVLADATSEESGGAVAAGLGWVLSPRGGVFMEASGETAESCREDLEAMLADVRSQRDWDWTAEETVVREHLVEDVGAAVVAAVFGPLAFAE